MKASYLVPFAALAACSARQEPVTAKIASAPAKAPSASAEPALGEIESRVAPLVRDHWAGAVAVAVVDASGERFVSVGEARPGVAADADTPFEIGSVSKTFTALALASMVEDHTVTLGTDVKALLPEGTKVPARGGRAITLADLATHTSGLPRMPTNFAPSNPSDPYADYDAAKLYAFLASYTLPRAPGETYDYSNVGFGLLGHALAKKSNVSYDALLRSRIFAPLGMTATNADGRPDPKLAVGHDGDGNEVPPWKLDALAGAGQVRSTARDMAKYVRAQLGAAPSSLLPAIALTHEKQHALESGSDGGIGLGWHIDGSGLFWHNGQTGGAHSFVAYDVKKHVGVAVLASGATTVIDGVGKDVLSIVRGDKPASSSLPKTLPASAESLEPLVGTYRVSPVFALAVTRDGDRLSVQATNQPKLRLYSEESGLFYMRAVEAKVRFVRDGSRVTGLVLLQNGREIKGTRE